MTETTTTTIPAGWPTPEMLEAGNEKIKASFPYPTAEEIFGAMMSAAPSPAPAAPSAAQWMPIETAPKDGTPVLIWGATLCVPGEMVVGIRSDEHDDLELWDIHDGKHGPHRLRGPSPTHWMPLPAAPGAQPSQGGSVSEARDHAVVALTREQFDGLEALSSFLVTEGGEDGAAALGEHALVSFGELRQIARIAEQLPEFPAFDGSAFLSAARASAPAAPEVVEALKGMMAAYPISTSVAQTDAIIKAHAALRSAGEGKSNG